MKLNVGAVAATSALLWSGAVLITGVANIFRPQYGKEFLQMAASIYPGYKGRPEFSDVAVGTAYAALDGAVGGAIFAWLYNRIACRCEATGLASAGDREEP
jgi:hypothetical protein